MTDPSARGRLLFDFKRADLGRSITQQAPQNKPGKAAWPSFLVADRADLPAGAVRPIWGLHVSGLQGEQVRSQERRGTAGRRQWRYPAAARAGGGDRHRADRII